VRETTNPEELCFYSDKLRRKLQEYYYERNEVEQEIIAKNKNELLQN
jgi:hypothetical protein